MAIFTHVGSHDMRDTGFPRVDRLSTGPSRFGVSQKDPNLYAVRHDHWQ